MFVVGLRLHSASAASSASASAVAARLGRPPRALSAASAAPAPDVAAAICVQPPFDVCVGASAADVSAPPTLQASQIHITLSTEVEAHTPLDSDALLPQLDRPVESHYRPVQFIEAKLIPQAKESRRARRRRKLAETNSAVPTTFKQSNIQRSDSPLRSVASITKVCLLTTKISSGVNAALGASRLRLTVNEDQVGGSQKAQSHSNDWAAGTANTQAAAFYLPIVSAACHTDDAFSVSNVLGEQTYRATLPAAEQLSLPKCVATEIGGQPEWSSACSDQSTPSTTTSSLAPVVVQNSDLKGAFATAPPILPPTASASPAILYDSAQRRTSDGHLPSASSFPVIYHSLPYENGLNFPDEQLSPSFVLSPLATDGPVLLQMARDYKDVSHPQCVYQNNVYQQHQQQFNSRLDHYRDAAGMNGLALSYSPFNPQFAPHMYQNEQMNVCGQPAGWHQNYEMTNLATHSHFEISTTHLPSNLNANVFAYGGTELHQIGFFQNLPHSPPAGPSKLNCQNVRDNIPRVTKQSSFGSIGQKRGDCATKPVDADTHERLAMFGWSLF